MASSNHATRQLSLVEGFYRSSMMDSADATDFRVRVWFRHDIVNCSSTYIIHNLPHELKSELTKLVKNHMAEFGGYQPYQAISIDSLIAKMVADSYQSRINNAFKKLLEYERLSPEEYDARLATSSHELHHLSQNVHVMREEMNGIIERIDVLIGIYDGLVVPGMNVNRVRDTLEYLRSRTCGWLRWLKNFGDRTNIIIQLGFHFATQKDNKTNREIAELTSQIAKQAQRDSSAMITIAVLTLIFLPGTFVSSVFSMAFFEKGPESLGMANDIWLYPAIAVPLTIFVISVWTAWRRRQIQWTASPTYGNRMTEIGFQQRQHERTGMSVGRSDGVGSGQAIPKSRFHSGKFEPIVGHSAASPHVDPRTVQGYELAPNKMVYQEDSIPATPLSSLHYG